jgi:hypothetical protein
MLARLVIPVLGVTALQTIVAGESAGTTPPATSIREWMTKPSPVPSASPAAAPTAQGVTRPATSIREWMTSSTPTPAPCVTATPLAPAASLSATPVASSAVRPNTGAATPKSPITISLTSTLRQGNLVIVLDDVPIFNEKFQKPLLLISQTTTWDPLQVAPGAHRLTAKVYGAKKTYFSKTYDLHVSGTKGSALRLVLQGDKLTVELAS